MNSAPDSQEEKLYAIGKSSNGNIVTLPETGKLALHKSLIQELDETAEIIQITLEQAIGFQKTYIPR